MGEALKLPTDGAYGFKEDRSFDEHVAWKDLTRENRFRPKAAKSSSLNSFIHKYLHRFISYSILARGESHGNVRKLELFVLWCGFKGKQISLTKLFADQMLSIASAKLGKIRVGSYITIIARYLNVLRDNYSFTHTLPAQTSDRLNLDSLAHHFMVRKFTVKGSTYWREVDKQGNTIWRTSDAPAFRKLAESEAPSTSKKRPRIVAPEPDEAAEPSTQLQPFLSQLQITLDRKLTAVQNSVTASISALESRLGTMDLKIDTIAGDIAYLRDHLPTHPESP